MSDTIPGVLRDAAERFGERPAYVDGDRRVTFTELLSLVQSTARGYVGLGFEPGDRLVLWAPNSIDWVVAALATSYAGGTLVPANSRYTAHEVAELVERTDAKLVIVADGFLGRTQLADLDPLVPGRTLIDITALPRESEADGPDVEALADAVTPDDVADILFTSGTTGKPKGAMSAHRQTLGVARSWAEVAGIRPDDRYLVVNPFFHSFGYKIGIVVGLLTGCTLYPVATFALDETMRLIQDAEITVLPGAPAIFQSMLTADRSTVDLSSLRLAVTGAAMIPVVLIERMKGELGIDEVLTAFGMTEAVVVTMCRQGDDAATIATTSGPGMEVRIDTDTGGDGELLVRGDHVMLGYLDDPEATAAAIDDDGWLHTGDIGVLDEAGNLKITDRLKDMYISGGFNVYPAEVEQALLRADGVDDVAVIGVPDERMGEVGKAFIVGTAPVDDVLEFARERLANFKIPRHVETIDVLPRNLSGKVLKNELRSRS